jgi:hypothetical protein
LSFHLWLSCSETKSLALSSEPLPDSGYDVIPASARLSSSWVWSANEDGTEKPAQSSRSRGMPNEQ